MFIVFTEGVDTTICIVESGVEQISDAVEPWLPEMFWIFY